MTERPSGSAAASRRITRSFLICHGLRWMPTGFILPVLVLVPTERGLDLATVGLMFAVYGVTTAVLELPTGGLADAVGRRPGLLIATVADSGLLVALAFGTTAWHFLAGALLGGAGRALLSGPLESWYVDRLRVADPAAALRSGLAAAGLVEGVCLAAAALLSAVLPTVAAGLPLDGPVSQLTLPLYGGMVTEGLSFLAVLVLLDEPRPVGQPRGIAVRRVVDVITAGLRAAGATPDLRRLFATFTVVAVALVGVEVLWQPRFTTLLGGAKQATRTFGYVVVAMSLGAAMGAWLAGRLPWPIARHPGRAAAGAALVAGAAMVGLALAGTFTVALVAFVSLYGVEAGQQVLLAELLHDRVPAARRATMVSVQSLCMQGGNVIASLTLTRLAQVAGIPAALWVGAVLLVLTAGLLWPVAGVARPDDVTAGGHPAHC